MSAVEMAVQWEYWSAGEKAEKSASWRAAQLVVWKARMKGARTEGKLEPSVQRTGGPWEPLMADRWVEARAGYWVVSWVDAMVDRLEGERVVCWVAP